MKLSINMFGLLAGLMLSLFAASTLHAQMEPGKFDDEKGWEEKVNKVYDKLDLSDEQRAQLKAQREGHRGQMKGLREQIRAKYNEFQAEIQKADFNAGKLKAINNDIKSLHNQLADYRLESILKVREILTPEQFAKFIQLKEEHRGEWKGRMREKGQQRRQAGPEK